MTGWQCPGCGACYGPFVERCGHCVPRPLITSTTSPPGYYWPPATGRPLPRPPENIC